MSEIDIYEYRVRREGPLRLERRRVHPWLPTAEPLDKWAGWWMCADGDTFPTRQGAIDHLKLTRWPKQTGRLTQIRPDLADGAWELEGAVWETVSLAENEASE